MKGCKLFNGCNNAVCDTCEQEVILAGDYYYHKILNSRLNYDCINA